VQSINSTVYQQPTNTSPTSNSCYLKSSKDTAPEVTDRCTCLGTKPFTPPPPLCPSMFTPAAIAGGTALPNGELCSSIRTRSECCTHLDGSASEYFGQRCVPPKVGLLIVQSINSPLTALRAAEG
jgi:hypothetical protein